MPSWFDVFPVVSDDAGVRRRLRITLERMFNEGFGAFLLSMFLLTLALVLLRYYRLEQDALDVAMAYELNATVGTREEPFDTGTQLGLIAVALSKVNADIDPASATCDAVNDPRNCNAIDSVHKLVPALFEETERLRRERGTPAAAAAIVRDNLIRGLDVWTVGDRRPDSQWADATSRHLVELANSDAALPTDFGKCVAKPALKWTQIVVPEQMAPADGRFIGRMRDAIRLSEVLDDALAFVNQTRPGSAEFDRFVQAYFISPDSVLRIWSGRTRDMCGELPKKRLWAAKSYASALWGEQPEPQHSTAAYLDVGGNGLVRTRCERIGAAIPGADAGASGGLIGAFCTDYKLDAAAVEQLRRQVFFETARVTFPLTQSLLDSAVQLKAAPKRSPGPLSPMDIAIDMQTVRLVPAEVRRAVADAVSRSPDPKAFRRDITPVTIQGSPAYLLPLGSVGDSVDAMVFLPRNPGLPLGVAAAAVSGLCLLGFALASGIWGWHLASEATKLRDRFGLLRNLQVGVMQVNNNDEVLECNDRAEELFGRRLPKYGRRAAAVNFWEHLIDLTVAPTVGPESIIEPFRMIDRAEVNGLRTSGRASWYFARVRHSDPPRWVRVSATPMMLAQRPGRRKRTVRLANVFASIELVPQEIAARLDRYCAVVNAPDVPMGGR